MAESNAATPPVQTSQETAAPDWLADVPDFVPQVFDTSQIVSIASQSISPSIHLEATALSG